MNEELHLGTLIKQKVKEKGLSVTEFARRIHCTRRNVYEIFKKNSLDTDLIKRISTVLDLSILSVFYQPTSKTEKEININDIENHYERSLIRLKHIDVNINNETKQSTQTIAVINNIITVIKSIELNIHIQMNTLNELVKELENLSMKPDK